MSRMDQLLTMKDKGVSRTFGTNGVLASLLRKMFWDLNVSPTRWGALMADFITDRRNGVPDNKKDQTSMRGNLTKEFARPQLTWKVFCKALRFLQIVKINIIIEAEHASGKKTLHSAAVNFGTRSELNDFLKDLDNDDDDTPGAAASAALPALSYTYEDDADGK